MDKNNEMTVKIFNLESGLQVYKDVKTIRLVSDTYNLLIMKDYMPILGEIHGEVSIKGLDVDLYYEHINAYYISDNNVFNLMIKEN